MSTEVKISTSAKNYANSLLQVGKDGVMSYDDILNDLNTVKEIVSSSTELTQVMENPAVANNTKYEILDSVFLGQINDKLVNFLKVLIDKNRFSEFSQIKADYEIKLDDVNKIQAVEITSAVELSEEYRERILQKLSEKLQKNIRPNWKVDENIIAGLIYRINDNVIDTSIKSKLDKLNKNLM